MRIGRIVLYIILAAAFVLAPVVISGEFAGTDDQATDAIGQLRPDYKPWAAVPWEPSEAAEPWLFALQAALGVGFIAYFAYRHRRRPAG
jgi:cobalt/nickel transport protein